MRDILKHFFDRVDIMQFFVGLSVMGIFFMLIYALIYRAIPIDNKDMVNHAIGLVEGAVIMVVGYYYGSSKGSARKDEERKEKDKLMMEKDKGAVTITPEPGATVTTQTEVKPDEPK